MNIDVVPVGPPPARHKHVQNSRVLDLGPGAGGWEVLSVYNGIDQYGQIVINLPSPDRLFHSIELSRNVPVNLCWYNRYLKSCWAPRPPGSLRYRFLSLLWTDGCSSCVGWESWNGQKDFIRGIVAVQLNDQLL